MSTSAIGEKQPPGGGQRFGRFVKEVLFIVVGALVFSSLIRAFLGQVFEIPSESMLDTLEKNDKVVVAKAADFQRGDIIVFADPGAWLGDEPTSPRDPLGRALEFVGLLPDTSTGYLTKRVIGTPGDKVECCDTRGRLSVNGHPLDESAYLYRDPDGEQVKPSDFEFRVTVPADRLFVMGDNRSNSADSRCHLGDLTNDGRPKGATAFVPIDHVVGPTVLLIKPMSRWRHFTVPEAFAGVPAPAQPPPAEAKISPADVTCY